VAVSGTVLPYLDLFLFYLTESNRISREIALEKLDRLSTYGKPKGRIIQDAARRMKGSLYWEL
jgi:hypothetical protein